MSEAKRGISYNDNVDSTVVRLDGKVVGHIKRTPDRTGWFYQPVGASAGSCGKVFRLRLLVKRSLESE